MSHLVLFDNEAVQALGDPAHPKHRRVIGHVQVAALRRRRAVAIQAAVPTSVRVEAGWDRTAAGSAFLNRLRLTDVPLDGTYANRAAGIRRRTGTSVADAHLGAVIQGSTSERITVISSDPEDMRTVAGDRQITVVTI